MVKEGLNDVAGGVKEQVALKVIWKGKTNWNFVWNSFFFYDLYKTNFSSFFYIGHSGLICPVFPENSG